MSYEQFISGLQLRHFSVDEIVGYGDKVRNGVKNSLPPEPLWPQIVGTLQLLDLLRHTWGRPITLLSIYRSPEYNTAIKGAEKSWHMKNNAVDFSSEYCLDLYRLVMRWRDADVFKGGIHYYRSSNFIHVDTRGTNADW